MNRIFIVDVHKNPGLLRFTETKLFYDYENKPTNWAGDSIIIDDISEARSPGIVINSGDFITTAFRVKYPTVSDLLDARGHPDCIQFTSDYDYAMRRPPPYGADSKQKYLIENLYKTIIRSRNLVYLDNTEELGDIPRGFDHFWGLASGWKSVMIAQKLGLDRLKSITIYDKCQRQLEFQRYLHSLKELPESVEVEQPVCGQYSPRPSLRDFWPKWHATPVNFVLLDLFETPRLPDNTAIWYSNVFEYEPTIFQYGWAECRAAERRLLQENPSAVVVR